MQKILIFTDENVTLGLCVSEYFNIGSLCQPNLEYVRRVATSGFDEAGERRRQLIVDQELHEAFKTAWSDLRAAYSMAA